MKKEAVFAQTLKQVCALAKDQGNILTEEQVRGAFADAGIELGDGQLPLVYDYLKSQKIGIGEPMDPFDYLSDGEADYLDTYLKELEQLPEVTKGEKEAITLSAMAGDADAKRRLIEIFLPEVTKIAKLYAGQGVFLEDLIGEGNVALTMAVEMLDCVDNVSQADGTIASMVMEAMENYITENTEEEKTGSKMADRANDVLEKAKDMAEELGRKVTVQELCEETGMTEEQIWEAAQITAGKIDYLDTEE